MGEIIKRLTDWKKSSVLRLVARFRPVQEKSSLRKLPSDGPVRSTSMQGLVSAAKDSNPEVRIQAVLSIRNHRDQESIPEMIELLQNEDPAIRSAAAKALRGMGLDDEPFSRIASMLSLAKTPAEKKASRAILQEMGDPRAISFIVEDFAKNPDGTFPEEVWIIAAVNIGHPAVIDSITSLFSLLSHNPIRKSTKESVIEMLGYIADFCNTQDKIERMESRLSEVLVVQGKSDGSDLLYVKIGISKVRGILGEKKDKMQKMDAL